MDLDQASDTVNIDEVDEDAETSEQDTSAIVDGPPLSSVEKTSAKSRTRRASEGQKVGKLERSKSNAGELRCDKCGKGYKHGSCLTKHLLVTPSARRKHSSNVVGVEDAVKMLIICRPVGNTPRNGR